MDKSSIKKKLLFLLGVIVFACLVFIGRLTEYLVSEYVYCTHNYNDQAPCASCPINRIETSSHGKIPHHLHQIFFFETSETLPEKLKNAKRSWIQRHPKYSYTLWNKTSIDWLITKEYPFLKTLYNSYGHWVRRADVARYLVLYHYGGWYVDLDVICKQSLDTLEQEAEALNKTVIVRETEPVGCSNDFIGITKRHPFLYAVLHSLHMSNRWYIFPYANTMFSTGPTFLWGRYLNYPNKSQFYSIDRAKYSKYIEVLHNSSWHSWDGKIVWYLFKDPKKMAVVLTALAFLFCSLLLYCKFQRKCV